MPIIEHDLSTVAIPDIEENVETPVGHVKLDLTSIKAKSCTLGRTAIDSQTAGLHLSISGASIALNANWHYREDSFPHIKDHGSVDITAGMSATVTVIAGMTAANEPSLAVAGCSASIDKASMLRTQIQAAGAH